MNIEDEILINSIIDRRDGQQFMEKLIKSYCSLCVENCQHLLELIPDTSDGKKFENPKFLRKSEKRLKRLQRRLSKKQKGSNQWCLIS